MIQKNEYLVIFNYYCYFLNIQTQIKNTHFYGKYRTFTKNYLIFAAQKLLMINKKSNNNFYK